MLALLGGLLFAVGIFHTMFTWTVDGWTVLAGVGVWVVRLATRRVERDVKPVSRIDTDPMGRL